MLPTKRNQFNAPTKEVRGDFPVNFLYTVGISGEKFFLGLKDQKIIGNTCSSCNFTYLPPKIFCEDCFDELGDNTYKELPGTGEVFSFTEIFFDHRGDKLKETYFLALIKLDGSSSTFFHKLVNIPSPIIGMKVKPNWNSERSATIFDINGFESS